MVNLMQGAETGTAGAVEIIQIWFKIIQVFLTGFALKIKTLRVKIIEKIKTGVAVKILIPA